MRRLLSALFLFAWICVAQRADEARWKQISLKPVQGRPLFVIDPPEYVTPDFVEFVRERLGRESHLTC